MASQETLFSQWDPIDTQSLRQELAIFTQLTFKTDDDTTQIDKQSITIFNNGLKCEKYWLAIDRIIRIERRRSFFATPKVTLTVKCKRIQILENSFQNTKMWTCEICEENNPGQALKCTLCGIKRPFNDIQGTHYQNFHLLL